MNGVRVYAAIERDSGLCMMQVVPDRTVDTGANYPAMVSPGHPHYIGWLGCVQEPGTAEGGGVSPRCSCPPTELCGSTTPRDTHPKLREPLDALNTSCFTSLVPQNNSLTLTCVKINYD